MLLLSIYVLYSNVTYIYPVSCLVEIKLFQIVSNCFLNIERADVVHKVWTESETRWKFSVCVPYVDKFQNGNG